VSEVQTQNKFCVKIFSKKGNPEYESLPSLVARICTDGGGIAEDGDV
jgi:hypothetical protein